MTEIRAALPDSGILDVADETMVTSSAHRSADVLVVAYDGARPIGLASCRTGRVHRTRRWLTVDVAEDRRRRGIGTELTGALAAATRDPRPFAGKAVGGSVQHTFARALGAVAYQTCPPATFDPVRWRRRPTQLDVTVVAGEQVEFETVLEAWLDMYTWVHASWSPIASRRAAREVFEPDLRANLDLGSSRFAVRDGRIQAGAWLFRSDAADVSVEAVAECTRPDDPRGQIVLAEALSNAFAAVSRAGTTSVALDCHITDPHLYPLLCEAEGISGVETTLFELAR